MKAQIRRLTTLEVEAAKRPKVETGPIKEWTEDEWAEYLFSWFRNGSLIVNRDTRRFEAWRLTHSAWIPECEILADGLNRWRDDTGKALIILTPEEVKEALTFIEADYFTMTHVIRKGYSVVTYNFARKPVASVRLDAYNSAGKTGTAIELYYLQLGSEQPRTIEEVEQFLMECDRDEAQL